MQDIEDNSILIQKINKILGNIEDKEKLLDKIFLLTEYENAINESSIISKSDINGLIIFVNDKFCEISGYTKEELIGKNHNMIRHKSMPKEFFTNLWKTILDKKIFRGVITNRKKNGESYYVDSTIIPILDSDSNIIEFIGIRHDVTDIFEKDRIIQEQFTDELTSLPNRQKLLNDLESSINPKIAIINIDRFRDINDFYGFEIGDLLLQKFTQKLLKFKKINLNIYRISNDNFIFLANDNLSLEELKKLSKYLVTDITNHPIIIDDNHKFYLTLTIGISSNLEDEKNNILTKAEFSLHMAKKNNQNIFVLDENLSIYNRLKDNKKLIKSLKNALLNDNLLLFGQKLINNKTYEIKYETLMRIKLDYNSILSPYYFLEQAKKAKLYLSMTRLIVKKACNYFETKNIEFSLNLTIEDLKDRYTMNFIFNTIKNTKNSHKITFEIVESEGINDFQEVIDFINKAKKLGCKIAIDDFGTGYSNFEYIIKLDVDYVKIDGSLIKNIHKDEHLYLTVKTIVNFAKALNIKTVAEFVHNKEVFDIVQELKIDYSQGYYLHEPEELK